MTLFRDMDISGLDLEDDNTSYALTMIREMDVYIGKKVHVDLDDCCIGVEFTATFVGTDVDIVDYHHTFKQGKKFLSVNGYSFDNRVVVSGTKIEGAIIRGWEE